MPATSSSSSSCMRRIIEARWGVSVWSPCPSRPGPSSAAAAVTRPHPACLHSPYLAGPGQAGPAAVATVDGWPWPAGGGGRASLRPSECIRYQNISQDCRLHVGHASRVSSQQHLSGLPWSRTMIMRMARVLQTKPPTTTPPPHAVTKRCSK